MQWMFCGAGLPAGSVAPAPGRSVRLPSGRIATRTGRVPVGRRATSLPAAAAETAWDMVAGDFASDQVLRRLTAGKTGDGLAIAPVAPAAN